jgi:hypothetical protein
MLAALIVAKYLGLSLAAASSIWATVNELTVTANGRKHLTAAGRVSIMLTIIGLVISIISEDLQRRAALSAQAAQIAAEAKRTNEIIVAGQPLTSLKLNWAFQGLDADLMQRLQKGNDDAWAYIADQQGERDASQNEAVLREKVLYPFLVALCRRFARGIKEKGYSDVVVLLALDDDQNAVLSFGLLAREKSWSLAAAGTTAKPASPLSLEIGSHGYEGNPALANWPNLERDKTTATIEWRLDPSTLAKSFSRQNQFVALTAKLPNILRIAILFDIEVLPFKEGNFALAEDQDFWKLPDNIDNIIDPFRGKVELITKDFSSSVRIVPNNSPVVVYDYILTQVYQTLFLTSYGDPIMDVHCLVFEFKLRSCGH